MKKSRHNKRLKKGHNKRQRSASQAGRRTLGAENLEPRLLLASDWQNPGNRFDVDDNPATSFEVVPLDANIVITELNNRNFTSPVTGAVPAIGATDPAPENFVDVTGDGLVTPLDAVQVINRLNAVFDGPTTSFVPVDQLATTPGSNDTMVNPTAGVPVNNPAAASGGDNTVVVWESFDEVNSAWAIAGQRYDASGVKVGTAFQVSGGTSLSQRFPSVAVNSLGAFAVAWQSRSADGNWDIFTKTYTASAVIVADSVRVNGTFAGDQRNPDVTFNDDSSFTVAWEGNGAGDHNGIFVREMLLDGSSPGNETLVNVQTTGRQSHPSVGTTSDGTVVVAWDGQGVIDGQAADGIFARVGSGQQINFTNGTQSHPDLSVGTDDGWVIAWVDDDAVVAQTIAADSNIGTGPELSLSFSGLEPLGSTHNYEAWVIVNGVPISAGVFDIDESGAAVDSDGNPAQFFGRAGATDVVISIEPANDTDPAPAATKILGGVIDATGNVSLAIDHPAALNTDFSTATGQYLLATPTTTTTDDELSGVWFLDASGTEPAAGLDLPVLPAGWVYEGWAVIDGVPVSTGRFLSPSGADDFSGFSGTESAPPFPGEDFVQNAPSGLTFPTDLNGATIVVSVEPDADNSPDPFTIKPLSDQVGDGVRAFNASTRSLPTAEDIVDVAVSEAGGTFTVTVTNVSGDSGEIVTPIAPLFYATHDNTWSLFTDGLAASAGLEVLAEDGSPADLVTEHTGATGTGMVGSIGADPLLTGDSFSFDVTPTMSFPNLTLAGMVVESNDAFVAPGSAGIALLNGDGTPRTIAAIETDILNMLTVWDAGTEANQVPGVGEDQAPRQSATNTGADDPVATVRLYNDATNDLAGSQAGGFASLTITHGVDPLSFVVTVRNTSDATVYPGVLTPIAWATHDVTISLFEIGEPATPGLESLAEDGDPAALAAELAAAPGVGASGVQDIPAAETDPGPILPGGEYQFLLTADADHPFLSIAQMIVPSNDTFLAFGPGGIELLDETGARRSESDIANDIAADLIAWDAGTEINQSGAAGPDQAPRQSGPDTGASELSGVNFALTNNAVAITGSGSLATVDMTAGRFTVVGTGVQSGVEVDHAADDAFALSWAGVPTGGDAVAILTQRYSALGVADGDAVMMNNSSDIGYSVPALAGVGSQYLTAWQGRGVNDAAGIFARLTDAQSPVTFTLEAIADMTISEGSAAFNHIVDVVVQGAASPGFALTTDAPGASIDVLTGRITIPITESSGPGTYNFSVSAAQGSLTVMESFTLTVDESNAAPTFSAIADQSAFAMSPFQFQAPAAEDTDLPADTLTYAATLAGGASLPSWLTFDPALLLFSGTPATGDMGNLDVFVNVSDGNLSASQSFVLTVNGPADPFAVETIADRTINEGGGDFTYMVDATIINTDGAPDTVTYSLVSDAPGSTINSTTGQISVPINEMSGGNVYSFTVTATDGSHSDDETFTLTVDESIRPPVFASVANQAATVDTSFSFQVPEAIDPDIPADTLFYSATLSGGGALPAWLSFDAATRTFSGTPLAADVGTVTVEVTADDLSLSGDVTFDIVVSA